MSTVTFTWNNTLYSFPMYQQLFMPPGLCSDPGSRVCPSYLAAFAAPVSG